MPLPEVRPNEQESQYVSRCIAFVKGEKPDMPNEQASAMCFSEFRKPKETESSPLEMLSKLKNWLNKYGYDFDDAGISDVIQNIRLRKLHIGLENNVYHLDNIDQPVEIVPIDSRQFIMVFPRGKHYIQKLDQWITFDDAFFNEIAESFNSENITKPFIDKNHELKESFGDVTGYEITPDGMVFEIELNNDGKELVRENTYKYISPSFGGLKDINGQFHRNALISISLTNIPALMSTIPALQDQISLEQERGDKMDLTNLTAILNLQDEASMTAITDAIKVLMDQGIEKQAIVEELNRQIATLTEEKEQAVAAAEQVSQELNQIKSAELEREANETIDLAISKGQYHPALKELKVTQFKQNKETIINELELIPEVQEGQVTTNNPNGFMTTLDEDDRKIALSAGYDITTKEGEAKYKKEVMEG